MNDKKHIDRLFQEGLKDFEATPNPKVWNAIQNELNNQNEPQKKPFIAWFKYAGIAALLLLFLGLSISLYNSNTNTSETIPLTTTDTDNNALENKTTIHPSKDIMTSETEITHSEEQNRDKTENNTISTNIIANTNNSTKKSTINTGESIQQQLINKKQLITTENKIVQSKNQTATKISSKTSSNNIIANSSSASNKSIENTILSSKQNKNQINTTNLTEGQNTDLNKNYNNETIGKTEFKENNNTTMPLEQLKDINKLENSIVEQETKKDSIPNSETIEDAIAKAESNLNPEEKLNKWSVNTNVAPVYYNTLGNGSHIHEQFNDNKKNGELNTSYGVSVGYALNNKIKIRTGLNKLNLSYDTADVIVYQNVSSSNNLLFKNINFETNNQGQTLSAISADNLIVQQLAPEQSSITNINAALSQRISYLEIPLEVEYALSNKRFGIDLIGGFSTFILNNNQVVTEVDDYKTSIGEANNINDVSFSTNLGFGLNYKFTKTFVFNLKPTFKYQINAYSNTYGDFRPYIIGVYTGFSYKF